MRTGAIFARGSCRALTWALALTLGVVTVLSGGEAAAQTAVRIAVPDRLVLTPSNRVDVNEGAGETFTVQLMTKVVETTDTAYTSQARPETATVTVTLSRNAGTDGAHFIVGGFDTHDADGDGTDNDPIAAGGQIGAGGTNLTWAFTLPVVGADSTSPTAAQVAVLLDPTSNKFVTVNAEEDAGIVNGVNSLVLASDFTWDHDDETDTDALELSDARMTIAENDNDTVGVTVDERTLTVLEGGDGEEYTVVLGSEPEANVTVTVAVTSVNANIMVNKAGGTAAAKQTLTFTSTDWMRKQTVTVTAGADLNTINGTATIKHTTASTDPLYDKLTVRSVSVTEIDSVRTITLTQSSDTVMEGEAVTITATLESDTDTPVTLGADVTVTLSGTGTKMFTGATSFKISESSTAGSTKLTAKHDANEDDEDVTLTASVSSGPTGIIEIPDNKVKIGIIDDDTYTLEAGDETVDEGDEVTLTVKLAPAAAIETDVMIDLYRASGATVEVAEGQDADEDGNAIIDEGETTAKFTLTTAKDANDSNDEIVVARAMAGGKVVGDPVTIMVRDVQAAANFTLSVDPDAIGEADGEASVMVTVMADKAVSADTTLTLAVDPAGTSTAMDPDDYSIMSADMMMVMIENGEEMGMTELMVTPVADGMDEPNETIVLTAWMDDAQVGNAATLTIIDSDSMTFTLSGPSDMNLVEGFEYDIEVTASTPVKADTTVMLMRGDASTATADEDYMVEDIMITAGETMGRTKLMVKSDDMPDGGTDGGMAEKLVLYGMVGNMRTNELSFYIWDLAVPALPVIAQLLLATLMAIGGYRRYRRR